MKNKNSVNKKAFEMIKKGNPYYFPLFAFNSFFSKAEPYFTLYLSAEIINLLVSGAPRDRIIQLVLITVLGDFILNFFSNVLTHIVMYQKFRLNQRETMKMVVATLGMSYEKLENPEIRQLRRQIDEASRINSHGINLLVASVERLINIGNNFLFSIALIVDLFVRIIVSGPIWYAAAFFIILSLIVIFNIRYSYYSKKKMGQLSQNISKAMIEENRIDDAVDSYHMGKDVRIYRQDKTIMKIKEYAYEIHTDAFDELSKKQFRLGVPLLLSDFATKVAVHLFVCIYVLKKIFNIGDIFKYAGIIDSLAGCITSLFSVVSDIKYNTPFAELYVRYLELCETNDSHEAGLKNKPALFEFRNVSFTYPSVEEPALQNINIIINPGEKIAIVGPNGSGKTTFVKLLCRLYHPSSGTILADNSDIGMIDKRNYSENFSVIFQDYRLFSISVGQNISCKKIYNSAMVREALNAVGLDRTDDMTKGLDTVIYKNFDKDGWEISGGESQKIATARALYRNAPVFVFDEPTASLDPISELECFMKFNDLAKGKTSVFVSHRLSACRFCDKIIVFNRGQIVQCGTHSELLTDKNGLYSEMWNAQAQFYA